MGNLITTEPLIFECAQCQSIITPQTKTMLQLKHGSNWVNVCDSSCYQTWIQQHDSSGYCCDQENQTRRPLLRNRRDSKPLMESTKKK